MGRGTQGEREKFFGFSGLQGRGRERSGRVCRERKNLEKKKNLTQFFLQQKNTINSKKLNRFVNYVPADPDVAAMLKREGPDSAKDPYKAAVEDAMIITMKGISAGMQNTG